MATHFIAMAGLHGELPRLYTTCDSYADAVEFLANSHGLEGDRLHKFTRDGYIKLNLHYDRNEYCEIVECNCPNPECHS